MKKQQFFYFLGAVFLLILITGEINRIFNPSKPPRIDPFVIENEYAKSIKCSKYDSQPIDSILQTYTVKPGDSLSLIAKRELGSIQLIDEIISLNKNAYPRMTKYTNNFLVEPGWKLRLPIKSLVGKFHNELFYSAGLILNVSPSEVRFTTSSYGSTVSSFDLKENQNFPGKQYLRKGECVYFLYEDNPWPEHQNILEVKKQ